MATTESPLAPTASPLPPDNDASSVNIPLSKIVRSRTNRHATVDDAFLASIRQHGVLEAVLVRPIKAAIAHAAEAFHAQFALGDEIYELVFGERRWLAAKKVGLAYIPAKVRKLSDAEALELQIVENDQRQDLNAMERCRAYGRLLEQYLAMHKGNRKYTRKEGIDEIAARVNRESRMVYQILQLRDLSPSTIDALEKGEITDTHAYRLCRRSHDEQDGRLMPWLREQREHSHGEIPSVRRLEREIDLLDREVEEKKKQESLFQEQKDQESQLSDEKKTKLYEQAVLIVRQVGQQAGQVSDQLLQRRLAVSPTLAREFLERMRTEAIVGPVDFRGFHLYIFPKPAAADPPPAKAPAPDDFPKPKPLSPAAKKRIEAQQQKQREAEAKREAQGERMRKIARRYEGLVFAGFAAKGRICSRFFDTVLPDLVLESWRHGTLTSETLVPQLLSWPPPRREAVGYTFNEVVRHIKRTKHSPGLFVALILCSLSNTPEKEYAALARYFKIDPKKLRKQAEAAIKEEERIAKSAKKKGAAA